ncbi:hypothetical protein ACFXG6_35670 [Streptomyces roseus]|uniref:hypothetical protein n=1 Tax=Streptomyces roseus TaxID=66430 RepID=UPI0036839A27
MRSTWRTTLRTVGVFASAAAVLALPVGSAFAAASAGPEPEVLPGVGQPVKEEPVKERHVEEERVAEGADAGSAASKGDTPMLVAAGGGMAAVVAALGFALLKRRRAEES